MTAAPVIALLTDFGLTDAYVGIMKGVILSRCPAARIVDITHDVAPGRIVAGAYLLGSAWRYFPAGTVFIAVVDPGVGSGRRILAAEVEGRRFVAPDNGLLSDVPLQTVVSVTSASLFMQPVSRTFHGRDIFAPVGAAVSCGMSLHELGPTVHDWLRLPRLEPTDDGGAVVGQVVYVDRFGNLITNLQADDLPPADLVIVRIAGRRIRGLSRSYADAQSGSLLAIIGSTERLEISSNGDSAAAVLNTDIGAEVRVVPG